jgi:hypothetical protein
MRAATEPAGEKMHIEMKCGLFLYSASSTPRRTILEAFGVCIPMYRGRPCRIFNLHRRRANPGETHFMKSRIFFRKFHETFFQMFMKFHEISSFEISPLHEIS